MKFYAGLLAVSALPGSVAFAPSSSPAFKTSLESSVRENIGVSSGVDMNRMRALEGRLASLTNGLGGRRQNGLSRQQDSESQADRMFETATQIKVQGGSLKTWSFMNPAIERVQVVMKTEGRPLDADVELWQGPDNTPHKMRVYVEDGALRPFSAVIETPRGPNTVAVRNIGQLEFPLDAAIEAETGDRTISNVIDSTEIIMRSEMGGQTIQGGALKTYPFNPLVESIQVLLRTDGRPLNSRIELLQGPNNNKQVVEVYTEDGLDRPFFIVLETPGSGNVVRIVNTSTMEFPLTAWVEAYQIGTPGTGGDVVIS